MPLKQLNREEAEAVALAVLTALTSHEERLIRFMSLSGLTPETIRSAAAEPGFLAGILDYVASDEGLLVELAGELAMKPEHIMAAQGALSPSPLD